MIPLICTFASVLNLLLILIHRGEEEILVEAGDDNDWSYVVMDTQQDSQTDTQSSDSEKEEDQNGYCEVDEEVEQEGILQTKCMAVYI